MDFSHQPNWSLFIMLGHTPEIMCRTISNNPGLVGPLPSTIGQLQNLVLLVRNRSLISKQNLEINMIRSSFELFSLL